MKFDEEGFRADLLAGNWSEWLVDEVVRRLEPYLTPDEDAIVITRDEAVVIDKMALEVPADVLNSEQWGVLSMLVLRLGEKL